MKRLVLCALAFGALTAGSALAAEPVPTAKLVAPTPKINPATTPKTIAAFSDLPPGVYHLQFSNDTCPAGTPLASTSWDVMVQRQGKTVTFQMLPVNALSLTVSATLDGISFYGEGEHGPGLPDTIGFVGTYDKTTKTVTGTSEINICEDPPFVDGGQHADRGVPFVLSPK